MNLRLLFVMLALSLSLGCAHSTKDDSPASDLDVLVANVKANGAKVLLPNGKEFCAEEARTEQAQDDCMADLEDGLFNANRRSERVVRLVERFAARERLRRNPCSLWERITRADRCQIPP
jgi:hypothetical protein